MDLIKMLRLTCDRLIKIWVRTYTIASYVYYT